MIVFTITKIKLHNTNVYFNIFSIDSNVHEFQTCIKHLLLENK